MTDPHRMSPAPARNGAPWRAESHVRIAEHQGAGGGQIDGRSPAAAGVGIVRLTVMRSVDPPGYVGHHLVPDTWTLVLTLAGLGEITCGGESWRATSDTVYAIPPAMAFLERQHGPEDWRYICLQVTVRADVAWLDLPGTRPLHRAVRPEAVALFQHAVAVLHHRPQGFELTAVGLCLAVFGELRAGPDATGDRRQLVRRAERVLDTAPTYIPTVVELARRCNVSASTLAHAFKVETGYAVHAYALRRRVQQAKGLLLAGARVGEVADQLGFSNPFHFSRVFRRVEGLSPKQFKAMGGKRMPPASNG